MINRDYTQEIGVASSQKKLSRPIAYAILALIAIGLLFGISAMISQTREHAAVERATTGQEK